MAVVELTKDGEHYFPFDADYLEICKRDGWREAPAAPAPTPEPIAVDPLVVGAIAYETVPAVQ
jgi:hypothetical protein